MTNHLRSVALRPIPPSRAGAFPFTVPSVAALEGKQLAFSAPVTFFVGENGSGKSTLLEAIACAAGSIAVGSASVEHDPTLTAGQTLGRALKLEWTKRTHRGFFLRAEDFFGYAKRVQQTRAELEAEARAIRDDPTLSERARGFGLMPYRRELSEIDRRYGDGLDAQSHGESFLTLFQSRFVPDGLYLLDEPEAPLSPRRQLSLIAMLKMMIAENAQFIIATHSPILMAFPGATIYGFDDGAIRQVPFDRIDHVAITRDFLANPEAFLRHL